MKVFFDENFPLALAEGLAKFQGGRPAEGVDVLHLIALFGQGAPDDVWLPGVGQAQGIVITQDFNIHRTRQLAALCRQHNTGMVFFRPPKKARYQYWQLVKWVMDSWAGIKEAAGNCRVPFELEVTPRGGVQRI
jgi:hypothetical protein